MSIRGSRLVAACMAAAMLAVACSGGGGRSADEATATKSADDAGSITAPDVPVDDEAAGAETDGSAPGASTPTRATRTTATVTGKTTTVAGGTSVTTSAQGGPPVADLFKPDEDRIGLSDKQITLCGHAATTFGPAFNTSENDLNVYWEMITAEQGGVYGRKVVVSFENDNYDPATAIQAAQACKDKKPFILIGGIGFDQIPAVRKFAEDNRMLYLHHIAVQDYTKKFSFSALPTVERLGWLGGDWVGKKHKGKKIGIIYRNSENWDPGREALVRRLAELGGTIVAQIPVQRNQGSYSTALVEMLQKGAQVVFAWENALAQAEMIQQAKAQNYHPQWVVFPFNVVTDALADQSLNPPLEGLAAWSAYSPGDYAGEFASYADEIKRFEATYRKYRPGIQTTDIHWQVWLAWKYIHELLLECGKDCTRNKLVGLVVTAKNAGSVPLVCPIDFTKNGHVGSTAGNMMRVYKRSNGTVGWKHIEGSVCKDAF